MDKGSVLSKKIQKSLIELDYSCVCAAPKVCAEKYGICAIEENYIQWTGKIFEKYDIIHYTIKMEGFVLITRRIFNDICK